MKPLLYHRIFLVGAVGLLSLGLLTAPRAGESPPSDLRLEITWGHRSVGTRSYFLKLSGYELAIAGLKLAQGEAADELRNGVIRTSAGGGDIDGLSCTVQFPSRLIEPLTNAHSIWKYLIKNGDAGAAERLQADPAWRHDPRKLTVQLDQAGTRGFSLTADQLLTQKSFWFPEFDLFVSAGDPPLSFDAHQQTLAGRRGQRVLDRVAIEPEASYAQYTMRWEDMGSPSYQNPNSVAPGHIVGLTWDSALYKFGVDRFAEVRNDYGKMDVFHFRFDFPEPARSWRGQRLADGLPIITTAFEKNGVRYEVEQFAFPLLGLPKERRGDLAMVLFQKVTLHELEGKTRPISLEMQLSREFSGPVALREEGGAFVLGDGSNAWLGLQGAGLKVEAEAKEKKKTKLTAKMNLAANGTREFVVKLPSPAVRSAQTADFLVSDYAASRAATVQFWNSYLERGAFFSVPEETVNTLFRANLWHALRLPRRHGGEGTNVMIDLPYSNFAYDQKGTPWPVNQSVYVDYMLYDLRGYHDISDEELASMYRNNQEPNGHVGGFANWGVYTPSMLYSVAKHYLLSGDRGAFEKLLPETLHALDWCLAEMKRAGDPGNPTPGLVPAPLNDLTHDSRSWAFNQAYLVGGVDLLGRALAEIHHPRAEECRAAARTMSAAVEREFGHASVRSAAVQLADGTWSPYVPTDAQASGRLFESWYPTDVDVGPLHLPRLEAIDPRGLLATAMLNDHEDNLFIHQWGTINEPVYNMQGTAYLLRDEPKAAIRTFYSTMACSFSHSVFEPVEHRWAWGQYFGPPSTDGSWFELYRNMLIREQDDDSLFVCQAPPRAWLEDGKRIEARRAPTYFGPISFMMESGADSGKITADIELSSRKRPAAMLVRFRHPQAKPIRSVSVNGQNWSDFDAKNEWVRIPSPNQTHYSIITHY